MCRALYTVSTCSEHGKIKENEEIQVYSHQKRIRIVIVI